MMSGLTRADQPTEIKTQMMHFRIRILDLLIIFASQNPASPHLQKLMVPLFTILSSRQKTDDFRTKSLTMLNKIIKGKEVVSGSKKEAIESLATVHELLRERADSKLNEIGVLVCAYLVKCVLNAQSEPVSKKAKKVSFFWSRLMCGILIGLLYRSNR